MIVKLVDPYRAKKEVDKGNIILSAAIPSSLTRKNILLSLIKQLLISEEDNDCTLITKNPRNYYIDLLLSKEM